MDLDNGRTPTPGQLPLFPLGAIVATPGALEMLERKGIDPVMLLKRHITGDWGDMVDEDKRLNDYAVTRGGRIFSSYGADTDPDRLWVITEADRSYTTILRPDEY